MKNKLNFYIDKSENDRITKKKKKKPILLYMNENELVFSFISEGPIDTKKLS